MADSVLTSQLGNALTFPASAVLTDRGVRLELTTMSSRDLQHYAQPGLNPGELASVILISMDNRWQDATCSISRSLGVLGERWTFLILREALSGTTRFADFQKALGVTGDVLTDRLTTLVNHGVMVREPYREPNSRTRYGYHLTDTGRQLHIVLGALQQWGDTYLPPPDGPTIQRRARRTDRPVHVAFIDDLGYEVPANDIVTVRTDAWHRAFEKLSQSEA